MLILGYVLGLNTLKIFFFHHDISCKVSSDNFIIALQLPLLYLRDLYLNFNLVLKYSGQNWFAGNKDVKVPKKSTKFSYSQFWFRWNNALFFIKFLFFLI